MKTKFVKGRWYKSPHKRVEFILADKSSNYLSQVYIVFAGAFMRSECIFSQSDNESLLKGIKEVSPNEVLQSIKTEGLSPEQLKEIADVFYVDGCRVGDYEVRQMGRSFESSVGAKSGICSLHGLGVTLFYGRTWATIISHPAYGDQDLREYGSVRVSGGSDVLRGLDKWMFELYDKASKAESMIVLTNRRGGARISFKYPEKEDQPKRKVSELREFDVIVYTTDKEYIELDSMTNHKFFQYSDPRLGSFVSLTDLIDIEKLLRIGGGNIYHASDFLPKSFYDEKGGGGSQQQEKESSFSMKDIEDAIKKLKEYQSKIRIMESIVNEHYKETPPKKQKPKYFVVKRDPNDPRWQKYIDWLNETYGYAWHGVEPSHYYGYDGNNNAIYNGTYLGVQLSDFKNNPTVLTLDEWEEMFMDNPAKQSTLITQAFKLSDKYSWKIEGNYLVPTEK